MVRPMDLIKVDVVRPKAFERAFEGASKMDAVKCGLAVANWGVEPAAKGLVGGTG